MLRQGDKKRKLFEKQLIILDRELLDLTQQFLVSDYQLVSEKKDSHTKSQRRHEIQSQGVFLGVADLCDRNVAKKRMRKSKKSKTLLLFLKIRFVWACKKIVNKALNSLW
jgi:hypothetical protein